MTTPENLALVASGFAAGVMNSLAGGGTILTFPTLVWLQVPAIRANATSTVALVPGAMSSFWGYRREVATHREWLRTLVVPSLAGGALGAWLLLKTPEKLFASLAPYLVLFATLLFLFQIWNSRRAAPVGDGLAASRRMKFAWAYQFGVAVYGGYFGAGIGILMLVALGFLGLTDIHAMNGLKNFFGACINGVAALYFIAMGYVDWPIALVMMAGAVAGGLAGAQFARKIGKEKARWAVVAVGLLVTAVMLWQQRGPSPEQARLDRLATELRSGDRDVMGEAGMQLAGLNGGPAVALAVYREKPDDQFGPAMGASFAIELSGPRLAPLVADIVAEMNRTGWNRHPYDERLIHGLRGSGVDLAPHIRGVLAAAGAGADEAAFRLAAGKGYDLPELLTRADSVLDGSGRESRAKSAAIAYLESLAAASSDARRILVRELGDSGMETSAEGALAAAGASARPEIDALLASETIAEPVRCAALRLVAKLRPATEPETVAIVRWALGGTDETRRWAAEAAVALDADAAVSVLEHGIRDPHPFVRTSALDAAGATKLASGPLFAAAQDRTKSPDGGERETAIAALVASGGRGVECVKSLARGGDLSAMRLLCRAETGLSAADLDWLVAALGSDVERIRIYAATMLGRLPCDISAALPGLTRLAADPATDMDPVVEALGRVGTPAVPVLVPLASVRSWSTATYAIEQLARLRCPEAEAAVVDALASSEADVRVQALSGLTDWKTLPGDARARVVALLADESPNVRGAAAVALATADFDTLRSNARAPLALCLALRGRRNADVLAAIDALGRLGPAAHDAVAYLRAFQVGRRKDAALVAAAEKAIAAIETRER